MSRCTPRYFVVVLNSTCCPLTSSLLGYDVICFDLLKIIHTVLLGLNFNPQVFPQWINSLTTFCVLLIIWSRFVPPISVQLSSAKPKPVTPCVFSIFIASLYAIIQNFALQTPPWGKPVPTILEDVHLFTSRYRCLLVM